MNTDSVILMGDLWVGLIFAGSILVFVVSLACLALAVLLFRRVSDPVPDHWKALLSRYEQQVDRMEESCEKRIEGCAQIYENALRVCNQQNAVNTNELHGMLRDLTGKLSGQVYVDGSPALPPHSGRFHAHADTVEDLRGYNEAPRHRGEPNVIRDQDEPPDVIHTIENPDPDYQEDLNAYRA